MAGRLRLQERLGHNAAGLESAGRFSATRRSAGRRRARLAGGSRRARWRTESLPSSAGSGLTGHSWTRSHSPPECVRCSIAILKRRSCPRIWTGWTGPSLKRNVSRRFRPIGGTATGPDRRHDRVEGRSGECGKLHHAAARWAAERFAGPRTAGKTRNAICRRW